MPDPPRADLIDAIAREEARIAGLASEQEQARERLRQLRMQLEVPPSAATNGAEPEIGAAPSRAGGRHSAAEKVALFRSLFRGRTDVYPKLWSNAKTRKKGYAPACANEWERGTCDKPRVKCGECPNQAFLPITDQVIVDHLQGRHTIGVYPLLHDESCWFLAVDFDKQDWTSDVAAFMETCRNAEVPAAIERSRSGNGAHVWFFFSAPVAAATARKLGCYLITETMARRHQLSMASYDRLFPNQDTMPNGGFGNLIALPLQREPREHGNTVFLDDNLAPHPDQWSYLANVRRIEPEKIERIVAEAARRGAIVGVRAVDTGDDEQRRTPWQPVLPARRRCRSIAADLPKSLRVVVAQRLFVEKAGLPSALLNDIKRMAAFQNPEFYKKQNLRLSTALTPRVIACAEEFPDHIALPRGCRDDIETLLADYGISLLIDDQRVEGEQLDVRFTGKLTETQERAARTLLRHDIGVFVAPPGIGKTVVGTYSISRRARTTLVLVHRQPLLEQWMAQLKLFLDIDAKGVGQIGAGKRKPNGRLDVAMIQSLTRGGEVDDIVANYGHVIVDECHHIPAVSFERILNQVRAKYVTGLTATPQRRDGHHPIIEMQLGPIRFKVDSKGKTGKPPFEHCLMVRDTDFTFDGNIEQAGIQDLYRALAGDARRNQLILGDVLHALEEGRSPILLTERTDQLEYFATRLRGFARHIIVLRGGMGAKQRRAIAAQFAAIPGNEERLILATGRYIGEGFDDARLDTLFLALPISWRGTLVQYAGRLHRLHPGKKEVRIFDYVDRRVPMLARMFDRRLRGYRAIGYERVETPAGYEASIDETVIEWSDERGPRR